MEDLGVQKTASLRLYILAHLLHSDFQTPILHRPRLSDLHFLQGVNASIGMLHVQERSRVKDHMCADQHDSPAPRSFSENLASLLSCTCLTCDAACSGVLVVGKLCVP